MCGRERTERVLHSGMAIATAFVMIAAMPGRAAEPQIEPELKGFCPAAYLLKEKAVKGDPAHTSTYAGKLYHLSSAEAKKKFDADPEKYLPQFGGLCTTALGGPYANRFKGNPKVFAVHDGKVYLFSSERARRSYDKIPQKYIEPAVERFAIPALRGYCPVSYQWAFRIVLGSEKYRHIYQGWVYHLVDAEALAAFQRNPQRYAPQYDGFCPLALSDNHRVPGDPNVFLVASAKTFLFADLASKEKLTMNPRRYFHRADTNWEKLKYERN